MPAAGVYPADVPVAAPDLALARRSGGYRSTELVGQLSSNQDGSSEWRCWPIARVNCSSTASSSPAAAGTFPTLNPATEEVLGVAADADRRRHGPGDRRGPPRLRRHRLVDQHRAAGALPAPAAARRMQRPRRGAARADHRRGRCAADADRRPLSCEGPVDDLSFCADTAESYAVDHRPRDRVADGHQDPPHRSRGRPSASSARSPRGTSRTRSTSPSSGPRWPRATPSCSSRRPTPRGARPCSASSSPSTPTSRPACVNIVTSSDHGVGALLSKDPRVDMVSFTGSTATGPRGDGRRRRNAQEGLPRTRRQVGVPRARRRRPRRARARCRRSPRRMHAGQGCAITTRLVVPRARYDEAVEAAAAHHGAR